MKFPGLSDGRNKDVVKQIHQVVTSELAAFAFDDPNREELENLHKILQMSLTLW